MFRIITTRKLAALREEASQLPSLREQAARADQFRSEAQAAREHAEHVDAQLRALYDDTIAQIASLKIAADDPQHGRNVRGEIALRFLRDQIARLKAEGDPEVLNKLWLINVLIGEDTDTAFAA